MANRQKLVHMHSNVKDKKPTPSSLALGELAVNYNKGHEFISTSNGDEVVKFSSDPQLITWIEKKEVIPYSGVVESVNLVNNSSSLGIKFNQVAAASTPMSNVINSNIGSSASFAISMDRYAMNGANPSFSSVTTTNGSTLGGETKMNGKVTATSDDVSFTQSSANGSLSIKEKATTLSGTSLDVTEGTVSIASTSNASINSTNGSVTIEAKSGVTIESNKNVAIESDKDICLKGDQSAYVYGVTTNLGKSCNNVTSNTTNINGSVTNVSSNSFNVSGLTTISGNTTVDGKLTVASGATISGDTTFKGKVTFDSNNPISLTNKLSWNHGKYSAYTEGNTYDGSSARTITFPSQVNELDDWDSSNSQLNIQGQLYVSGPLTCQTAIYSSDIALKENIEDAHIFKKIAANKVNVKSFNFKSDETKAKVYGILAQDVEAQGLGEIVFTKEDGYKAVDYTSLMMLKISFLENENRLLRYDLSKIYGRLEKLEKQNN